MSRFGRIPQLNPEFGEWAGQHFSPWLSTNCQKTFDALANYNTSKN